MPFAKCSADGANLDISLFRRPLGFDRIVDLANALALGVTTAQFLRADEVIQ